MRGLAFDIFRLVSDHKPPSVQEAQVSTHTRPAASRNTDDAWFKGFSVVIAVGGAVSLLATGVSDAASVGKFLNGTSILLIGGTFFLGGRKSFDDWKCRAVFCIASLLLSFGCVFEAFNLFPL